ncbi:hypothetical protein ACFW1M_01100 [Streptomyces inhibens]
MAPVMVELAPTRTAEDPDELVVIEDVDAYTAASQPGCGEDNPYQ